MVLNGKVTNGNKAVELTCIEPQGSSVIDLCCISVNGVGTIKSFKVDSQSFIDHLPIELEVFGALDKQKPDDILLLVLKLIWLERDEKKYKE